MPSPERESIRASYDIVADEYAKRIYDELRHKPLDRALLERFAARVGRGPACDLGCGPGHVARYLHDLGVSVCGVDLSPGMVERARALNPGIEFRQGDMTALDAADGTWTAITAFYSIVHTPPAELATVFGEMRRVLRPGGLLLLAFHVGDEAVHLDELWEHRVDMDFFFFRSVEITTCLCTAGFEVEETIDRDPYADVEYPSRRSYVFASKSEAAS